MGTNVIKYILLLSLHYTNLLLIHLIGIVTTNTMTVYFIAFLRFNSVLAGCMNRSYFISETVSDQTNELTTIDTDYIK